MTQFGVCKNDSCGKWGIAPDSFDERIYFLKCPSCNELMYLSFMGSPTEVGYAKKNEIVPIVIRQKMKHRGFTDA